MASSHPSFSAFSTRFQRISALLLWLSWLVRVDAQNPNDEVGALLAFKAANSYAPYDLGYFMTWKESDKNPCAWVGVSCTDNSTVSELALSGWDISYVDSLNLLSNLTGLRHLDLSSNLLTYIPDSIGSLSGLTLLDLSQNFLFGVIPSSISSCRGLRFLSLQENSLFGEISSLRGLVNLQILLLADNLFSGPVKELGELRDVAVVDLSHNNFSGSIPALPNLTSLVELRLDNNSFTSFEEPWFLAENSTMVYLSVSSNSLEGPIPSNITNLPNLNVLNMSCNGLSGDIPFGFSRQVTSSAFSLDLSQNQLTGIPSDMFQQSQNTSCEALFFPYLNLSYNFLTGSIPIDGANYWCFATIDLSHNNLSGPIPSNIFSQERNSITYLWLHNNHLSGDIVEIMVESPGFLNTVELRLQNNMVTGNLSRIAHSNLSLRRLETLDLRNNDIRWSTSQAIPDPMKGTLETLTSTGLGLEEFRVGGNNFSGTSLPITCFVNQSVYFGLRVLDLSNSHLKGQILGTVFHNSCLTSLQFLNLSNNNISGPVPESVVRLPFLTNLDVSNNNLSGLLPLIPVNSSLYNPSIFGGNPGLCGYPLQVQCSLQKEQNSGLPWWVLFIIIGVSITIVMGTCLLAMRQWKVYSKRHQQDADLIKTLMEKDSTTLIPLQELKKATNNFSTSAKVGEGGFGVVYKGKLNNGTIVAIKRSKREGSMEDKDQFLNDVRILSQVNHRNLVKLLGCCMENKIAVLVFEFVSNGTLQEHLQGKVGVAHLSWKQRLLIAVQSADALNYLHSAITFPIYHRDVKSANILLDDDLHAKVADFGISRLAPMKATHVSTAGMGTIGYIDPQYWASFQLTDKSDVYSFGVVLLELISAQPAIDLKRAEEEKSLVFFASRHIESGKLEGLIDPTLMETLDDSTSHGRESILKVGRLGMKCVSMRSKARPSMNEVLKELQNLWLEFNGTSTHLHPPTHLDAIIEDPVVPLFESFSASSSSYSVQSDASGIQMSQFTCSTRFK